MTLVRLLLLAVSLLFATISLHVLIDPVDALSSHGLDLSTAPASAFADIIPSCPTLLEIRAFYFGTMAVLSAVFLRGGRPGSSAEDRLQALAILGLLLGLFTLGRVVSWRVDGPALLTYSAMMWTAEGVGACLAGLLWIQENARVTTAGQGSKLK
mmetsp:Transcript_4780/g.8001  ORF Transcript_4780/g.8001 Transcript_4780/m.8001 type:complete len:155 (-) Transcript_4780:176-640(-)